MNCYLLLDFGSTYTKLTLVDIDNQEIVTTANDYTTVETNIIEGYNKACEKIREKLDMSKINIKRVLACSSAAGGLKMVAIGITPEYTVEAAKRAALGAGARILKVYKYLLSDDDIEDIENRNPDIILLSGGAEDGNKKYIIRNAEKLTKINNKIPIVVSGNTFAYDEIKEIFKERNIYNYQMTENLMPDVNMIEPVPVREVIRKIFMNHITNAKGMRDVTKVADKVLMPTPTAVLNAAQLLAKGINSMDGVEKLIIADVGGATTDIHSVGEGFSKESKFFYEGLVEPYVKRTVEGDLGMRYSAISLYECLGKEKFKKYLDDENVNIDEEFNKRKLNVFMIPSNQQERDFDTSMAKACVNIAIKRHSGRIRESYLNGRNVIMQRGKDLRDVKVVIGTGGVIVNNDKPRDILETSILDCSEKILSPKNPDFYLDEKYILSAMGLLATEKPEVALKILKDNLKKL